MTTPIVIFYHAVFSIDGKHLPASRPIVHEQMQALKVSGLEDAASEIYVGINGDESNAVYANGLLPAKAKIVYHGNECRNELRTLLMIEDWCRVNQREAYIFYFHSKGATHAPGSSYGETNSKPWRLGMMADLVTNWGKCVVGLMGHDIVCSHWMWDMADGTQHIPAGNFLWVKASFVRKLPSIFLRDRLKVSGLDSIESRYEAEVYWGNGPRPTVKQFKPNGGGGVP